MQEVWGYARVSTDEQADDEGALIKQMRRLRSAGATKIYYDVESRTSDKRKGLLQMIEDINTSLSGKVSKLLFIRIDRLTSSSITFYLLMDALKKKEIQPMALDEPFDLSSIGGELTIDVRLAAAKYEVKMLGMRVKKDLDTRRANKKPHWNAPLGYVVEKDKYKFNHNPCVCLIDRKVEMTVADVAKVMFDIFFEVESIAETARRLYELFGISAINTSKITSSKNNVITEDDEIVLSNINKASSYGSSLRYPYTGLKWSITGLRSILVNPVYAGGTPYNTQKASGHRKPFDEWDIAWDTHEDCIVTREQHFKLKGIIRHNRNNRWGTKQEYVNPFEFLVKCTHCGGAYTRQSKKLVKKAGFIRHHYQCSFYRAGACNNKKMISSDSLERQIIAFLVKEAEQLSVLIETEEIEVENSIVNRLKQQLQMLEAIPNNPAIEKAKDDIRNQMKNAIAVKTNIVKSSVIARERVISAFNDDEYWAELPPEDKRNILRECIKKIVVDGNRVVNVEIKI
jgi:DNA invertase Pin-like site-specific DNA recombinase